MISCSPDCPLFCAIVKDDFEFLILLLSPPRNWDYQHVSPGSKGTSLRGKTDEIR